MLNLSLLCNYSFNFFEKFPGPIVFDCKEKFDSERSISIIVSTVWWAEGPTKSYLL